MVNRLLSSLFSAGWGLFAQALSLAATFLPVVFQRSDALVVLVTYTAIATVTTPAMTLAAQVRIPAARSRYSARVQTLASFAASGLGGAIVFIVTWLISAAAGARNTEATAGVLAALCVAQSVFTIGYAILVRRGTYRNMMLARLAYAGTTFGFTLWAVLANSDGLELCAAAAAGYSMGFVVILLMLKEPSLSSNRRVGMRFALHHLTRTVLRSLALTLSLTIGAVAGQVGALATPMLGSLAGAWALMIRVMSGFQTIGVVIVGSSIDAKVAAATRSRDHSALTSSIRFANLAGVCIGALGVIASLVTVVAVEDAVVQNPAFPVLIFTVIGFVGSNIVLAPIGRILGLVGKPAARLLWDCLRCALLAPALLFPNTQSVLVVLTLAGLVSLISYFMLLQRAVRAHGAWSHPKEDGNE